MTMLETVTDLAPKKRRVVVTDQTIEDSIEWVLAAELAAERMALDAPDDIDDLLGPFEDWADGYGLAPISYVCAAYILELHHLDEDMDHLRDIARAFEYWHARDVVAPIRAALTFCSR